MEQVFKHNPFWKVCQQEENECEDTFKLKQKFWTHLPAQGRKYSILEWILYFHACILQEVFNTEFWIKNPIYTLTNVDHKGYD